METASIPPKSRKHTRVLTACEACRLSKTRCDSSRPCCGKCLRRGVACIYPESDPLSILQEWGSKILDSVERQERFLAETLGAASPSNNVSLQAQQPQSFSNFFQSPVEPQDTELISRNDTLRTPITGSDMILSWPIFPQERPVSTFPPAAFEEKSDRFPTGWSFDPRSSL
ncbi:hypothetical protein BDV10DRAFT_79575 [Aspergillus recurvatus]